MCAVLLVVSEPAARAGINVWTSYGPDGAFVCSLAIDPSMPNTLYAGTERGVFKSTDGGATWSSLGLTNIDIDALAIDPGTPTTLYAGTYGDGVFKSMDGGRTWNAAKAGLTNDIVYALAVDPLTPSTLYAGVDPRYPDAGVFKSTDGGSTWQAIDSLLKHSDVWALAIDPLTPTILYAGTDNGGVFKSTDGGATWSSVGLTDVDIDTLAIDPGTPSTFYAGTYGDGGFKSTGTGGVFKSTDGGATWSSIGLTDVYIDTLAIDPGTPTTLYAGTYAGRTAAVCLRARMAGPPGTLSTPASPILLSPRSPSILPCPRRSMLELSATACSPFNRSLCASVTATVAATSP